MRPPCLILLGLLGCNSPSRWSAPPAATPRPAVILSEPCPPAVDPGPERPLVAAVRNGAGERALIMGLWADGRLLWSADPLFGGPPFQETRLDGDRLAGMLNSFGRLFDRWEGPLIEYHPEGASHIELVCTAGGHDRRLASWHEAFERNPALVVTDRGVEDLDGRERARVWAEADPDYRRFRLLWGDVRALMRGIVPAQAEPPTPLVAPLLPPPR
jgi:hypothetical protein